MRGDVLGKDTYWWQPMNGNSDELVRLIPDKVRKQLPSMIANKGQCAAPPGLGGGG
jgi:hypothetical protein